MSTVLARPTPPQIDRRAPEQNHLLRAFPSSEYERLLPVLEPVHLAVKQLLCDRDARITHVYFPTTCVASMVNDSEEGSVEVGTVGREGMVGAAVLLHTESMPTRTFAQIAGSAKRLPVDALRDAVRRSPDVERLLFRYLQAFFEEVAQSVACNRLHTLEERCARWLLMTHDRVDGDEFTLTQEFLSYMLGVHRPAVTLAAGALQHAGVIRYHRGRITVVNRAGLEQASCSCYSVTRAGFRRLLGDRGR
ncbi:MAG: Crp/Fnr family transcriptional regulator [Gemmatimonadaceae bacterium]